VKTPSTEKASDKIGFNPEIVVIGNGCFLCARNHRHFVALIGERTSYSNTNTRSEAKDEHYLGSHFANLKCLTEFPNICCNAANTVEIYIFMDETARSDTL
jgi:hypothetical protein